MRIRQPRPSDCADMTRRFGFWSTFLAPTLEKVSARKNIRARGHDASFQNIGKTPAGDSDPLFYRSVCTKLRQMHAPVGAGGLNRIPLWCAPNPR
jgi:hypothetical protein